MLDSRPPRPGAPIWAVYARRAERDDWKLAAFSVISEARARGLAERDVVERGLPPGFEFRVERFANLRAIRWTL